jgi:hypothetical protein
MVRCGSAWFRAGRIGRFLPLFERDDQTIFVITTRGNDRDAHFYQFTSDPENRYEDSWSKVVVDAGALVTSKGESDGNSR